MRARFHFLLAAVLAAVLIHRAKAAEISPNSQIVGQIIRPLMAAKAIPGMAVGIIIEGRSYVFDYGVAVLAPRRAVTNKTLFEIGSISKTFNAVLAAYAQKQGDLSLSDMASADLPALRGTAFDKISLTNLGTYTPGGMPLQVPDGIDDDAQLLAYFKAWKPAYAPGTMRTYSNPSIGLLGFITAARMHADYTSLLQSRMFPALGLRHCFLKVPPSEAANYAQGYEDDGTPIRMSPGVLDAETYGVRITASDLLRFLAINMQMDRIDPRWQRAVTATHTGYFRLQPGGMVQDLAWEQYTLPLNLPALEAGNSDGVLFNPNPAAALNPPSPPQAEVLLNKTGSTNGFGAYVMFIPASHAGIVLLANKSYPIPARVAVAYAILSRLGVTFHP